MNKVYADFIPEYDPRGYDLDGNKTNAQYVKEERLQWNGEAAGLTDEQVYLHVYGHWIDTFLFVHQRDDHWPYPLWSGDVNSFRALPFLRLFHNKR